MNAAACKHCVRLREERDEALERVRQLREMVFGQQARTDRLRRLLKLTPSQATILGVLIEREVATFAALMPNDPPDEKIIAVMACLIRKRLKPHGVEIKSVRSIGYQISAEHRARLNALIDGAAHG